VYNLTKFGVGAFSDSLRQELATRHVRVSVVEPGAVNTELVSHIRPEVREQTTQVYASIERLEAEDIADVIAYVVTRHRRVAVNEILVRPTRDFDDVAVIRIAVWTSCSKTKRVCRANNRRTLAR
jgi:NADP-dependent 3-hydroxy acid dehydrogenase YdfG